MMNQYPLILGWITACLLCISCSTTSQNSNLSPKPSTEQESTGISQNNSADNVKTHDQININIPSDFDYHKSCFSSLNVLYDQDFVLSSLQIIELNHEKTAILLESHSGDIRLLLLNKEGEIQTIKNIASLAQISCAEPINDGFRIGIIERNPIKATYSLEVQTFDPNGNQISDEDWNAKTRGFTPDPGTKCGFIGQRDMIVVGTKPRQDKPPYHGMFSLHSNALILFDETKLHTPEIVTVYPYENETHILVREVVQDENNKTQWPYILYRFTESGEMEKLDSYDLMAPKDEFSPGISQNGCYMGRDDHTYCSEPEMNLSEIVSLRGACGEYPEDACMMWIEPTHRWLVKMPAASQPQPVMIPQDLSLFSYHLPGKKNIWLAADKDSQYPDSANHLRFIQINPSCLW